MAKSSEFPRGGFLLILIGAITLCGCGRRAEQEPLLCYVGGTMRPAMERLAADYEKETGQKVLIDYAGSGELFIKIDQTRTGDLFVKHDPYQAAVMKKGLATRGWTVASLRPVIVVPRGNPRNVRGFRDLAKPDMRLVFSHPVYSTAGWIISAVAQKGEMTAALQSNIVSRTRGGGEAANAVTLGTADAAICWDAVAHLRRETLMAVPIEDVLMPRRDVDAVTTATYGRINMDYIAVTVALLKFSKQPQAATAFAEYLTSPHAAEVWKQFGFSPADPERLAPGETARARPRPPALHVHCAAGMRAPVTALASEFEKQSGVRVTLALGGSNVLLGQIELNRQGDIYIAGDADYIDLAATKNMVAQRATLCHFVPVILVPKGNPRGLATLGDLTREGLRIAQGEERATAIGRLTPRLLALHEIDAQSWTRNVVTSMPTVNELGLAVKLGTADAALVWDVVARDYADVAEAIALPPERNVCPRVEGAVLTFSEQPAQAAAFLRFLTSERSRAVLTEHGYRVEAPQ
jgi:molybdate transport system substrate-binding protein